ncbi:hypothetical protein PMAYCL1PPCAC_11310, partial [Pristionchus mayeri]
LRERMPTSGNEFPKLFRRIYTFTAFWPMKHLWINKFFEDEMKIPEEDRVKLNMAKVNKIMRTYTGV